MLLTDDEIKTLDNIFYNNLNTFLNTGWEKCNMGHFQNFLKKQRF